MERKAYFTFHMIYACTKCRTVTNRSCQGEWCLCNCGHKQKVIAAPDSTDCALRGQEIRREECPTCNGRIQVKVFACSLHGECTLTKDVGAQICATCPDRKG